MPADFAFLRDRIAYAIAKADCGDLPGPDSWDYKLADAVIAELSMTAETSYGTTYPKVPVTDVKYIRYVTDWTPHA